MNAATLEPRQIRGLALAQAARIKQIVASNWLVPSQSNNGGYLVDTDKGTCTCPDHELRGEQVVCKHRWAVEYARHHVTAPDGSTTVVDTMRITYTQDWSAYNAAQCNEKDRVQVLLKALCEKIENPVQLGRGRPRAALSNVIFAATMKTFVGMSGRRSMSDIRSCAEKGFIDKVPSYNTVFDYLERSEVTPVLKKLIRVSAAPLATVETK